MVLAFSRCLEERTTFRQGFAKEEVMFLPKSDVFKDLRQEAVNEISEVAVEESWGEGAVLFSCGDPANYLYLLVEGRAKLGIGDETNTTYVVERLGEAFGWSSVVGRESYCASAECLAPTKVLKIDKTDLEKVFDAHERSGRKFYRSLAASLGQRLIDMHR